MARAGVQGEGGLPVCASNSILGKKQSFQDGKLDRKVRLHRPPKEPQLHCPECGSQRLWKAGFSARGDQLLLCRSCFRRFQVKVNVTSQLLKGSDTVEKFPNGVVSVTGKQSLDKLSFIRSEDVGSHMLSVVEKDLNSLPLYNRERRVCVSEREAKNLVAVNKTETTAQDRTNQQALKGELVTFMFHLSKLNLDKKTIYSRARNIELLYRNGVDLNNPDSVLTVLATNETWRSGTKNNLLQAYKSYARWKKIDLSTVDLPKFKRQTEQPYVPKETQLDQLIAGAGWKTGAFLQLLKETGARTVEAARIKWSDIDVIGRVVTISNPAKNGMPRQIHVSEKCIQMLSRQPRKSDSEYVFGKNPESIRRRMRANFHWARGYIAAKTANNDLLKIHLHTFRHFFATKLYLQVRDIRYVQKKMGHRSITSTTIYENSEPNQDVETYTVKAVTTREEAEKLIALGYEFHYRTPDGVDLFRKKVVGLD